MVNIVVENFAIGFWKEKSRKFTPLANFSMKLLKHIRAPPSLPQYSGFIVRVSQRQRSRNVHGDERYSVVQG